MRRRTRHFLTALILTLLFTNLQAQDGIYYGDNFVVFEAEATTSPITKWTLRTPDDPEYQKYIHTSTGVEPIFDTYLEYTGPWAGGVDTELEYKFTCPKTGTYRMLMRMHQPLRDGEAGDQRNDVFVRLHGNYTSETPKPKTELEKNHKFWGRGVNKWGSCHKLEIGGVHYDLKYGLTEGEEYTFVMSGRSNGASIDYILFYHTEYAVTIANNDDIALKFPENYRPGLGLVDPTDLTIPLSTDLREGTSLTLPAEFEPINAKKDVEWSTSNSDIVSVDEKGNITATGTVGQTATITVTSKIVEDLSASCEVTIVEFYPVAVDSITISPTADTVAEGQTAKYTATVWPLIADDQTVKWSSSLESVATVDDNGVVTAVSSGTATIRATSSSDDEVYGEATIVIAELFSASLLYDDDNKYLGNNFYVDSTMLVTVNYHAGTFNTVKDAKVWLRHMASDWKVIKDYPGTIPAGVIGSESGSAEVPISLVGAKPNDELGEGEFYFLFTKFWFSDGNDADKGLNPINIIKAEDNGGDDNGGDDDTTSVASDIKTTFLSIYPNPASDYIKVFTNTTNKASISVFSSTGQLVFSDVISRNETEINTSAFSSGLYVIKVENNNGIYTEKVLIK